MAFSFGGNKSKSQANMNQEAFGADQFNQMYNQGNQLWNQSQPYLNLGMGQMNQASPYMINAANYGQAGADYMGQGGSFGDTSAQRDQLYASLQDSMSNPSQMGKMYEDILGGPGNTYIDPMVESMKTGMMDNLGRMQSGTGLNANAMGQGGSSRHAMQNAMQAKEVNQDMAGMENIMRGTAYDKDLNWKMNIAQQADLGRGQAQDRMMGVLQGGDQNRQMGMGYMPTQQNLGMGTMAPWMQASMMPWNMYNQYSQGMGDPTVLSSGSQSGGSGGFGIGF